MSKESAEVITFLSTKVVEFEIKTKALTELLVENTSITMEDVNEKCEFIENRDFPDFRSKIREPLNEYNESFGEHKSDPNKSWY